MSEEKKEEKAISRRKYLGAVAGLGVAAAVGWGLAGYLASKPKAPTIEKKVTITKTETATPTVPAYMLDKGPLTIYTALEEDETAYYLKNGFYVDVPYFSDANVTWLRQSTGEIVARIIAEKDNPMADVLWGTSADQFTQLVEMGLIEPYVSPEAKYYDERFKDPNGYWVAATMWVDNISINTKVFEEQKLGDPPQTWKDLLDPKWKGKILAPNPNTSGTGFSWYVGMVSLLGEDGAIDYCKKLDENVIEWTKSGGATCRRLGTGENAISITGTYVSWVYIKEGYPIKNIFPPEGCPWAAEATGLIKGAKNPNMAKAFIDWALGKHANELYREFRKEDCSTRKDLAPLPGLPRDIEQPLVKIDFAWAGKNKTRLLDALNNAIPRLKA